MKSDHRLWKLPKCRHSLKCYRPKWNLPYWSTSGSMTSWHQTTLLMSSSQGDLQRRALKQWKDVCLPDLSAPLDTSEHDVCGKLVWTIEAGDYFVCIDCYTPDCTLHDHIAGATWSDTREEWSALNSSTIGIKQTQNVCSKRRRESRHISSRSKYIYDLLHLQIRPLCGKNLSCLDAFDVLCEALWITQMCFMHKPSLEYHFLLFF